MVVNDELIENNIADLKKRLSVHLNQPDGVIYDRHHSRHRIVIRKKGSEIALYFAHPSASLLSGIMSEIDLTDPLKLIFGYTRAFMLTLAWCAHPKRVYMLGFAGGRVPMVLYHHYPEVIIEGAEIDPDVLEIAQSHFGVHLDERQQVALMDGRAYLQAQNGKAYDVVLLDAFLGTGYKPYHLATIEFYEEIKSGLSPDGVVALNLGTNDALYRERINTFMAAFKHIHLIDYDTANVIFGSNHELLSREEIVARTRALEDYHQFSFALAEYAERLLEKPELDAYLTCFTNSREILRDGKMPLAIANLSPNNAIFYGVGRDDLCPCGSSRKFKQCHGRHKNG